MNNSYHTDYNSVAFLYDDYFDAPLDAPLLVGLATRYGSPVLDIACGTGRVAVLLAREGFEVDGIDSSPNMLALAEKKKTDDVEARFFQMDATTFTLDRRYGFICIPNGSFMHLLSERDQRRCLHRIYCHLRDSGGILIDVVKHPESETGQSITEEENWYFSRVGRLLRVRAAYQILPFQRIVLCEYRFIDPLGQFNEIIRYTYRIPDIDAIVRILEETGFRIADVRTGYTDADIGKRYVIIAEKNDLRKLRCNLWTA